MKVLRNTEIPRLCSVAGLEDAGPSGSEVLGFGCRFLVIVLVNNDWT